MAEDVAFRGGSYEVAVILALPHLESNAARTTRTICLPGAAPGEGAVIPVLSDNNPLAKCAAKAVTRSGATLAYDIARLAMDISSDHALLAPGEKQAPLSGYLVQSYMMYYALAIGGGAPNIQRNVIGERGLGLPRDARR